MMINMQTNLFSFIEDVQFSFKRYYLYIINGANKFNLITYQSRI